MHRWARGIGLLAGRRENLPGQHFFGDWSWDSALEHRLGRCASAHFSCIRGGMVRLPGQAGIRAFRESQEESEERNSGNNAHGF